MTAPASTAQPETVSSVDWSAATRRARALVRPGPRIERGEASLLVESLRSAGARAPELVGEVTGLTEPASRIAAEPVYVVDRGRWIGANIATFAHLTDGLLPEAPNRASARLAGEELGVVLPLLASRVLGQYDPFAGAAGGAHGGRGSGSGGRLMLVAPNVLHVQRELRLDPGDFHLWVALHEQTHALQFAAAPWLPEHLTGLMRELMGSMLAQESAADRLRDFISALPRAIGSDSTEPAGALLGSVMTESEHEMMGRTVAVMSLLEGHADVVMDAVGPQVVPTVSRIRAAFDKRRNSPRWAEAILRRLMGMDAKLAQYRNGAAFVRAVVDKVGHEGLNAVWTDAANLPASDEISDPDAWLARVHG
ncbi:zinc-dependent metalloprotease [Pseudactinotalea sp. Z1748]|uniref:zinc-dependent metalloprotease n=1 Tax=Pseudactinotalea sp. Z1748 TaxID=3413027 RepID=UPI003C7BE657